METSAFQSFCCHRNQNLGVKEYYKKKYYLHIALLLFFLTFLYFSWLWFTTEMFKSLHKTSNVLFHIYSSALLWTQRVNLLLKFCNIPNGFCLRPLFFLYNGVFFVNYLCFQLCACVPDLLKKKKKEIWECKVMLTEIPLTLYQIFSTYCLGNLAHFIYFNFSFGVTCMTAAASSGEEDSSLMVHRRINRWEQWEV